MSTNAKPSIMNVKINMENDEIEVLDEVPATTVEQEEYVVEEVDEMEAIELIPSGEDSMAILVKELVEHVCGKCNKTYKSFNTLKRHMLVCRIKPKFHKDVSMEESELARKLFSNVEELERLAQEMEDQEICFCCEENFSTAHTGHIRCPNCPKAFKNSQSFERHLLFIHASNDDFPCDICNAKCPTKVFLELHKNAHKRGKPFACQKCGKEFTRRYHLIRHEQYTSCDVTKRKEELPCEVCGKVFFRLDNLRLHLRGHMGESQKRRDYQCLYCDMAFYGSATLNIHLRTHTGEKPFACDLCDKSFPSNPALRKHRRTHTGEKPYKCSTCSRAFAAKEVLNRHMKIHTGERPHACNMCGKRFIQATQLKSHMFNHTGENGFKCETCGANFNRKSRLTKHLVEAHTPPKKTKWTCVICCQTFKTQKNLECHLKTHENNLLNNVKDDFETMEIKSISPPVKQVRLKCPACYETFVHQATLTQHIETKHKLDRSIVLEEPKNANNSVSPKKEKTVSYKIQTIKDETDSGTIIFSEEISLSPARDVTSDKPNIGDVIYLPTKTPIDKISQLIKDEIINSGDEDDEDNPPLFMDDNSLNESVSKLLHVLLDEAMLKSLGWPNAPIDYVLKEIIKQCGHVPNNVDDCSDYTTQMRDNVKLLFNLVIDNNTIKALLNNNTIDEVIHHVLKMANVK